MRSSVTRTLGPVPAPNGASVVGPLLVPEGVRWVQITQGAQEDLVIWWEAPGESPGVDRRSGEQLERDGQVIYVGGLMERGLWIVFPASSSDTDPAVILRTSSDLWPFQDPGAFPEKQAVSLDFDDHLAEREYIGDTTGSIGTGTSKNVSSNVAELTYPHKWRSVVVNIASGTHNAAYDGNLELLLYDATAGRCKGHLGTWKGNSVAGGFPVVSFTPPPFDWVLRVANASGVGFSGFGEIFYSTNPPSR